MTQAKACLTDQALDDPTAGMLASFQDVQSLANRSSNIEALYECMILALQQNLEIIVECQLAISKQHPISKKQPEKLAAA